MASGCAPGSWVPQKGDVVRLESGFDRSLEAIAARRAGLPLSESAFYEVVGCARGETSLVLMLSQVRVVRVGGVRHIARTGSAPFPYISERFKLVPKD
jgi:hypothetical protein